MMKDSLEAPLFDWTPVKRSPEAASDGTETDNAPPIVLGRFTTDPGGTLRPWDAADEYLVNTWPDPHGNILVINDDFGAIACALLKMHHSPYQNRQEETNKTVVDQGQFSLSVVNDSAVARTAIARNIANNSEQPENSLEAAANGRKLGASPSNNTTSNNATNSNAPAISIYSALENLPADARYDSVLVKIPKATALLEHQLTLLRAHLTDNAHLLAAAMARHVHNSTLSAFERTLTPVRTSLARKKARLIIPGHRIPGHRTSQHGEGTRHSTSSDATPVAAKTPVTTSPGALDTKALPTLTPKTALSVVLETPSLVLKSHPVLFSAGKLDPGSRFLLHNLPKLPDHQVIADLGCGNGILGIVWQLSNPTAHCHFIDDSAIAITVTAENHTTHCPQLSADFHNADCLTSMQDNSCDRIVCNPPFHEKYHTGPALAHRMFAESRRVLRRGGEMWIVANRHLPYPQRLEKLFGRCETIAGDNKFSVYRVCH